MEISFFNKECLVSISHQFVLIMSLSFVHTVLRSYRLGTLVSNFRNEYKVYNLEEYLASFPRGRRSRNKVSVGEPSEGSVWLVINKI